ncbi:uncharacterized protein LOC106160022 [Lingula anatina]|uniref:Uncharacterized protein LOC106160022 n=1 Tax=Lingula anatina TaxID=7574 RepID=A0A1S3I2A8_LINAN|nr:uncharacterized protein LOC106160022 [Lingula anatina]|eukprot:XP_013391966.1 uncharacterized protein LOC106160022 [Lingula anatina]
MEAPPPLGPRRCTLMPQNLEFQEIEGEVSKVWFLRPKQTYDCGHLIFDFVDCVCLGANMYPIIWNFFLHVNSESNRIFGSKNGSVGLSGNGCMILDGTGGLQIPFFKNMGPKTSWIVGIVFNRPVDQHSTIMYRTPFISINGDEVSVSVEVRDTITMVTATLTVSVVAPGPGYILVIVRWYGNTLTLTVFVDGILYQDSVETPDDTFPWAIIFPPAEPLFVGHVPRSFVGEICLLYFTDKWFSGAVSIRSDILLYYIGPPFG